MRRLARRLFTLCSVVSLLLCVAACVAWVRSHRATDLFQLNLPGRYVEIAAARGTVHCEDRRYAGLIEHHPSAFLEFDVEWSANPNVAAVEPWLGVRSVRYEEVHRGGRSMPDLYVAVRVRTLPAWFPVAVFAALPTLQLAGAALRRGRRRARSGAQGPSPAARPRRRDRFARLATAASFALCLAIAGLWLASCRYRYYLGWSSARVTVDVGSEDDAPSGLTVIVARPPPPGLDSGDGGAPDDEPALLSSYCSRRDGAGPWFPWFRYEAGDATAPSSTAAFVDTGVPAGEDESFPDEASAGEDELFEDEAPADGTGSAGAATDAAPFRVLLFIPFWAGVVAFVAAPAIRSISAWRRRGRRPGCCRACGYDLRASLGRCPECGSDDPPGA